MREERANCVILLLLLGNCFWREGLEAAFGAEGGDFVWTRANVPSLSLVLSLLIVIFIPVRLYCSFYGYF
jgi:hypothetical protein